MNSNLRELLLFILVLVIGFLFAGFVATLENIRYDESPTMHEATSSLGLLMFIALMTALFSIFYAVRLLVSKQDTSIKKISFYMLVFFFIISIINLYFSFKSNSNYIKVYKELHGNTVDFPFYKCILISIISGIISILGITGYYLKNNLSFKKHNT